MDDLLLEELEDVFSDEDLTEARKRTSRHTVKRKTKIKRATGQLSTAAARRRNDPLYKRMIFYRERYYKYRAQIHKKYSPRVRSKARR